MATLAIGSTSAHKRAAAEAAFAASSEELDLICIEVPSGVPPTPAGNRPCTAQSTAP